MLVVHYAASWFTFRPELKKNKKSTSLKNSLYFSKWNFLALIIKNFKERKPRKKFLIFREIELLSSNIKKFQETETLKNLLLFREMEPFSPPRENFLYFRKQKPGKNLFKKSFSCISDTSKIFFKFQEMELFYISGKVYSEP